jgi:hypothetical protein
MSMADHYAIAYHFVAIFRGEIRNGHQYDVHIHAGQGASRVPARRYSGHQYRVEPASSCDIPQQKILFVRQPAG